MKQLLFNLIPSLESETRFLAYMKQEEGRKNRLCELFDEIEADEKSIKSKVKGERKYSRMFRGTAYVGKKKTNGIILYRSSGRRLGVLVLPDEAVSLLNVDDDLDVVLGFRDGVWRIISVFCIGSVMSPENDPGLN
ncbi:MAG: hypothetical protein AABZ31_08565 [Bdellovibrionota bacterium]